MNRLNFRSQLNNSITRFIKIISKTNRISLFISFLLLLILTIQSCKKSKDDVPVISDPIESARIALADATKEQHAGIDTSMYRQSLRRTILWEKALLRKIGDSTIVYAPIKLSKELTIKEGGQPGVSVNSISWLVVTKFKDKYKFDMVLRIPNKEKETTGKFNGTLIVDDWFGKRQTFFIDKDKQKSDASNRKDANGDLITTMGSSCRTTSYTICAGDNNHCYTTYETTCTYESDPPINDNPYDPYGGGDPGGQTPGNSGGGGEGDSNQSIITNNIKDPCLKALVDNILNHNFKDKMSDIMSGLSDNTKIDITFNDREFNPDGKAANSLYPKYTDFGNNNYTFSETITLGTDQLSGTSKEYATTAIIHEIIHNYFSFNARAQAVPESHQMMADSYITPMASYLTQLYPNMSIQEAIALAWSGVNDTNSYKGSSTFAYPGGTMTKQELLDIYSNYVAVIKGTGICN